MRKDPMNFNSALLPCLKTNCELWIDGDCFYLHTAGWWDLFLPTEREYGDLFLVKNVQVLSKNQLYKKRASCLFTDYILATFFIFIIEEYDVSRDIFLTTHSWTHRLTHSLVIRISFITIIYAYPCTWRCLYEYTCVISLHSLIIRAKSCWPVSIACGSIIISEIPFLVAFSCLRICAITFLHCISGDHILGALRPA